MFFISRSRFDEMLREKNMQIGYRDGRIAELEAERRLLWDKICLLGIGAPVFEGTSPPGSGDSRHAPRPTEAATAPMIGTAANLEDTQQDPPAQPGSNSVTKREVTIHHRPSMIMRRMDRLAEERWLRKVRPAKTAEWQRDEVMTDLNAAHIDGVKAALPKI